MSIIVDGMYVSYQQAGNGPVVLLIHGWGDSLYTFDKLVPTLQQHFTVLRLDLPGFGKTDHPPCAWDLDDYAVFVSHFLEKIEVASLLAIVGHSNGAAMTVRGMATDVLSAKKLVLIGAAGIRNKGGLKKTAIKITAKVGKLVTFWLPKTHKQKLQKMLYGTIGSDMLAVPHMKETFKLTVKQDIQGDAKLIHLPTLLVYGAQDKATPVAYGELLNQLIPSSRLEVIDGADHFVHQSHPDAVGALINTFLIS